VSVAPAEHVVALRAHEDRAIDPAALAPRYVEVRAYTEALAAPLSGEDQTVQSMPDVSPTKWHRAHTTWFFETFVLPRAIPRYREFDPEYRYLFNSYYEAVGARHPRAERGLLSRPGIAEIAEYRRHVDAALLDAIDTMSPDLLGLVELGLHHEQQHQELLLMDIKHVLSRNPLRPAYRPAVLSLVDDEPVGWTAHAGGLVAIGHDGNAFAFDNESPRHREFLEPYALADRTVSCGDWLAFIDDGGYERPELWLSDGWAVVQSEGWDAPLYWQRDGDSWQVFTLSGMHPVDPGAAVCHISYYEADAFAHWSGSRLPTEAEWEAATAADGPSLSGDVWQWTASAYLPYPRFRPAPGAVGEYNGKFMVNQHVLRGGCGATPAGHVRVTYRNFFPPGARWAFSGARLARDA
jgi:ergothioneine biosynthesis protein EgtB